jgi:hypothetical protein
MVCQMPFKLGFPSGILGILEAVCATSGIVASSSALASPNLIRIVNSRPDGKYIASGLLAGVFASDVADVLVVLVANVFDDFSVGKQRRVAYKVKGRVKAPGSSMVTSKSKRPRSGRRWRPVMCSFFSVRVGREIEPELVVETNRIHHQRVACPLAGGVAIPGGVAEKFISP